MNTCHNCRYFNDALMSGASDHSCNHDVGLPDLGPEDFGCILWEPVPPSIDDVVQLLDNVSATLELCLARFGHDMSADDLKNRNRICAEAREMCDQLLRKKKD